VCAAFGCRGVSIFVMLAPTFEAFLFLAVALAISGLVAGFVAGLLGVGGGIVVVPVLFHALTLLGIDEGVRMHLAVGTSLATIVPTSLRSTVAHRARGAVDGALLRAWAPYLVAGVIAGALLAGGMGGQGLTLVFASVALVVAFNFAFGREDWRLALNPPHGIARAALATGIGFVSTLMGIGGGTLGVPALTLFNVPIHRAVGTAAGLGLIISVPGSLGFIVAGWEASARPPFSLGYVSLVGLALMTPLMVLAAPRGAALAHRLSRKALARAFALFLVLTSLRMFASLLS
jgi:uncharacterized membrane protein YfcA